MNDYHHLIFSFLSKRGIKEDILAFDARNISPEIRESVEKLLKKNAESFDSKVGLISHTF